MSPSIEEPGQRPLDFPLYVEEGVLHFYYNGFGAHSTLPEVPPAAGDHEAVLDTRLPASARAVGVLLDGRNATGWGDLSPTLMVGFHERLDRRCPVS